MPIQPTEPTEPIQPIAVTAPTAPTEPIEPIEPIQPIQPIAVTVPTAPTGILIVCTANRCRSPIAEAVLRRRLEERGIAATVSSAGLLPPGYPAMDDAVATAAEVGLDLTDHLSRTVTRELVAAADLVIAMERQHVVDLAVLAPDVWPKIFQLRDLIRRAEAVGRRARDRPLDDWLAELGAGRSPASVFAAPLTDDIPDPVAGPRSGYDRTRLVLDELLSRLAALL